MPKVARVKAPKKASGRNKVRRTVPFISRARAVLERYSLASIAGAGVVLCLFLVLLFAGGYFGMAVERVERSLKTAAVSTGFEIQKITLIGAHQTAYDEVLEAVGPVIGTSSLHFDLDGALDRVESLGWVRSAAVSRLLPNTVHVSIRERVPAAIWQVSGRLQLVDANGVIIREVSGPEYAYLPLIVGAGAPKAAEPILKSLQSEPVLEERVYALVRVGERRWNMRLRNDTDIKLPESNYVAAIKELAVLQAAYQLLDQEIEYIDLRDPEQMIVKRQDGSTQAVTVGNNQL